MSIIRSDKRNAALATIAELRNGIQDVMRQADGLQAALEVLELDLGLASEGDQAKRAQCIVMHCQQGSDKAHTLDECTDECHSDETIAELEEAGEEKEVETATETEKTE